MTSDIFQIRSSLHGSEVYIDSPFLIDSGIDGETIFDQIGESLAKDLDYLFLTHCHFDHIAGARYLSKKLGLEIIGHKKTKKAIDSKNNSLTVADRFKGEINSFKVDIVVNEKIEYKGFEIIPTPGHTDCGISLFDREKKICFVGDLFFPQGNLGRTDLATGNEEKMKDSIEKLRELDIKTFYTGHGGKASREDLEYAYEKIRKLNERDI
ncbi:hypothetical protein C9439_06450 [archaeon SCG-AAA382B04]|nr:hypothetical protein C9439_06450 [archaeon SCG-AAA382B04]